MTSGFLIAFEGIDGSGKSTQWQRLDEYLRAKGYDVVMSYEPTHRTYGKQLRDAWLSGRRLPVEEEIGLFEKDRREHVENVIKPALQHNATVLLDRYYYSSAAYQGVRDGQTPEVVMQRFEQFCPRADICLLFDLPVEEALQRMNASGKKMDAMEVSDNLERVRTAFLSLNRPEIVVLNASLPPDELEASVRKVVPL